MSAPVRWVTIWHDDGLPTVTTEEIKGHDDGAQDALCSLVYGDGLAKTHPDLAQSGAMGMLDILRSQGWALVRIDAPAPRADDRG